MYVCVYMYKWYVCMYVCMKGMRIFWHYYDVEFVERDVHVRMMMMIDDDDEFA